MRGNTLFFFFLLLSLLSLLSFSYASDTNQTEIRKKLIYFVVPSLRGHILPLIEVAKEFRARNYDIFFITEIDAEPILQSEDIPHVTVTIIGEETLGARSPPRGFSGFARFISLGDILGKKNTFLYLKTLEALDQRRPDYIFYEFMTSFIGDLANKEGIPALNFIPTPTALMSNGWESLNIPSPDASLLETHLADPSFFQRTKTTVYHLFLRPIMLYFLMSSMNFYREKLLGLEGYKTQEEWLFAKAGHPLLLLTPFPLDLPRPSLPFVLRVPPLLRSFTEEDASSKLLSAAPNLSLWLSEARLCSLSDPSLPPLPQKKKLLYLSFGSVWIPSQEAIERLVRGLVQLKKEHSELLILWARGKQVFLAHNLSLPLLFAQTSGEFKREHKAELEDHSWLRLDTFVPQKLVLQLCRSDIVAYVTHCGASSTLEGLSFTVPLFGVPLEIDQFFFASRIRELQLGDAIFLERPSTHQLPGGFDDVTHEFVTRLGEFFNESQSQLFRLNEQQLVSWFRLNSLGQLSPADTLELIVRSHIQHPQLNSIKSLIPFDVDWPFWKKRNLDVLFVLFASAKAILFVLLLVVYLFWRCCCSRSKKKVVIAHEEQASEKKETEKAKTKSKEEKAKKSKVKK